mgnify:CR=1 FL=1|jgi:hypothetical protein
METKVAIKKNSLKDKIHTIRGIQVMLDRDLAELYGVETKVLNQAVKRNIDRFPEDFMFQLSKKEFENLRSQFVTSRFIGPFSRNPNESHGGRRYFPYVFTEQGVAALSGVIKSSEAIQINIQIVRAFVAMRKFIVSNAKIFSRLDKVEQKQIEYSNPSLTVC